MELSEIKALWDESDKLEDQANLNRWDIAQAIADKLDEGATQVALAEALGRKQPTISLYARVWRKRESINELIPNATFHEAERWVQANPDNARPRNAPEQPTAPEPREPLTRPAPQVDPPTEPEQPIRTPAEYKADRAVIDEQLQPLKNAINSLADSFVFTCGVSGALEEIVEAMDRVNPQYVTMGEVKEAYELMAVIGEKLMQLEQEVSTLAQPDNRT